jgi:hypothetical protein
MRYALFAGDANQCFAESAMGSFMKCYMFVPDAKAICSEKKFSGGVSVFE